MCGIFGVVKENEEKSTVSVLLKGLKRLEYRGYDSAGIAFVDESGRLVIVKQKGDVSVLEKAMRSKLNEKSKIGIAHTRWATHGKPSDANAHPHTGCSDKIALVHNGIIENYSELKDALQKKGHKFRSQTDTEIIAHLIETLLNRGLSLEDAVKNTLKLVKGTYGLAALCKEEPNKIVAAKLSSPLVIGKGKDEIFLASDPVCLGSFTKEILFLKDHEIASISPMHVKVSKINGKKSKTIFRLQEELGGWESKGNYKHFMIKEIHDQPEALQNGLRGRIDLNRSKPRLGGIEDEKNRLLNSQKITIVGCGTSLYAGQVIGIWLEELTGIQTITADAGELKHREYPWHPKDTAVFLSQSGETADLLAALKLAKQSGVLCLGLVNVVGSSIARETDAGVYLRAGPEIGVASTKAFTSQLLAGFLLSLKLARYKKHVSKREADKLLKALERLPRQVKKILDSKRKIIDISNKILKSPYLMYMGRWLSMPIACEGALKMKEIAYIFSEGLSSASIKHGPLALIEKGVYTISICPKDKAQTGTISNMHEVKARNGLIVAITNKPTKEIKEISDHIIQIPESDPLLTPILSTIAVQLLSYYSALKLKRPIDKPRNLAKSVTVE